MQSNKILPKIYEDGQGNYPQHKGKPKLSYSAYNSFLEDGYRGEMFANYFLGLSNDGNIFTSYGSKCGQYFEDKTDTGLTDFDRSVIDSIKRPENARYESEIVVDRGWYVIQGFSDREYFHQDGLVVEDLKTGAVSSKVSYYGSDDYQQTTLYSYQREVEGHNIINSRVILLDRKGNGQEKYPLRLTGDVKYIETPYSTERAEKFLKKFDEVAEQISEYYKVYNKFFTK
jgi:hypothetical protein